MQYCPWASNILYGGVALPVPYIGAAPLPGACSLRSEMQGGALQQPECSLVRYARGGNLFFFF